MARTLLIGLDGATWDVLGPLMADGTMPYLAELVAGGARADLLSTPNPLTPPAWTSLVTGRTPGHHGIFDFIRAEGGADGVYFTLNTSFDVRCETLWALASRQQRSITSLNFPVSTPPRPVNGFLVPGFVPWKHLRRAVHPPELWATLKAVPGFDARELAIDMNQELKSIQWLPAEEYEAWIDHHIRRERQWFGIARALLGKTPTDLFAVLFDGVDKLQHLCWRYIDPALAAAAADPGEARVRARCLGYFRELDGFIRELVALAGPETRTFLASDHGFGATSEVFYANVWLERQGYLAWRERAGKDELGRIAADRIKSHVVGLDWTRTRAYALTPSSNGIWIRRAEAPGAPGVPPAEYEAFRRRLAAELLAFRHPRTGRPVVTRVMTREEAFPGPASDRAPDLTLVLADHGFLSVLDADEPVKPRPEPAGTHRPEGIFAAAGPGIARGARVAAASIIDVAPTLLWSLDLPVPSDLEGRVIAAALDPALLAARPARPGPPTLAPDGEAADAGGGAMTEADEEKVMARLRGLGYME
jgi:predicted AlkP superfamily phosphohydrolase/phosphomutase